MSFPLVKLSQGVSGPCLSHWRPHSLHRSILKFMVSPARPCLNSLHMVQKYRNSLKLKEKKAKIIRVNTTKSNMASLLTQAQSSLAHVRVHLPFADTVPHYDVVNSTSASAGRENLCSLRKAATPLLTEAGRFHPRGGVDCISK